jgi:hypothetical protein
MGSSNPVAAPSATRLASFIVKDGAFVYGSYPDIDALFPQQAVELNPKKAGGDPRKDTAVGLRKGDQRTALAARFPERDRAPGGSLRIYRIRVSAAATVPVIADDFLFRPRDRRSGGIAGRSNQEPAPGDVAAIHREFGLD